MRRWKGLVPCLLAALIIGATDSGNAATIVFSQNFDTDPVNYTISGISDPFRFQASDPTRYWGPSNLGMTINPGVTGDPTTYLAAQNMNNDGDGTLAFDQFNPAQIDFTLNVSGNSDLKLTVDLAGMPTAEVENFVRAWTDDDGDGSYETQIFNFAGSNNSPYIDTNLGPLSGAFATFADIPLNFPTAADHNLRLRFELFTDTNSLNEAQGVDNIKISGAIPEPTIGVLGLTGLFGLMRRRRC